MVINKKVKSLVMLGLIAASISGCKLNSTSLPAISDSGNKHLGHVVWHDLITPDITQSQKFYSAVFNWQFKAVNDDYVLVSKNGDLIAGMAQLDNSNQASHWLALISVDDVDTISEKVNAQGGKVLISKATIEGRGDVAVMSDSQGAVFSVIDTTNGDPLPNQGKENSWIWQEVWSDDPNKSQAFYQQLGNYQRAEKSVYNTSYSYLKTNDKPAIGFVKKPSPEIGNTWVNYIKVNDVQATLSKVTAAGGEILMVPNKAIRNRTVAVIRDPAGAGLVIQEDLK